MLPKRAHQGTSNSRITDTSAPQRKTMSIRKPQR